MSSHSHSRKDATTHLVFAAIYITVGALLIYWNFTGAISSVLFAIGIFVLIIASLIFKFVTDYLRRKK
jgi:Flp pilus assembly protein TadB